MVALKTQGARGQTKDLRQLRVAQGSPSPCEDPRLHGECNKTRMNMRICLCARAPKQKARGLLSQGVADRNSCNLRHSVVPAFCVFHTNHFGRWPGSVGTPPPIATMRKRETRAEHSVSECQIPTETTPATSAKKREEEGGQRMSASREASACCARRPPRGREPHERRLTCATLGRTLLPGWRRRRRPKTK